MFKIEIKWKDQVIPLYAFHKSIQEAIIERYDLSKPWGQVNIREDQGLQMALPVMTRLGAADEFSPRKEKQDESGASRTPIGDLSIGPGKE